MSIRDAICDAFNAQVSEAYPDSFVKARLVNYIGELTISVDFAISKVWANNIIHNDKLHMRVLIQQEDDSWVIEGPIYPHRVLKANGAPFRKIRGKSEAEAMEKLTKWFLKNADILKSIA